METIGQRIKEIRIQKGLTQAQLGEKCGMADSAIRRYESDRGTPKLDTLNRIADALDVNVLYFLDANSLPPDGQIIEDCNKTLVELIQRDFNSVGDFYNAWFRGDAVLALMRDAPGKRLLYAFEQLNADGKKKAAERVEELTEIPKYRKDQPTKE